MIKLDAEKTTDLHMHTYYSDGSLSPEEMVRRACERGITLVSVTDHDGTGGTAGAAAEAGRLGISFVNGAEFSTADAGGTKMHILGYGFDPEDREIRRICEEMRESRAERNELLFRALNGLGYDIPPDEVPGAANGYISKPQIAAALVARGIVPDVASAFDEIFDRPEIRALQKRKTDTVRAIKAVTSAGGTAVLAHPMLIKTAFERGSEEMYDELGKMLTEMTPHGLGGLECCCRKHTDEEERRLLVIAGDHGLTATRGSDDHGPDR